jgi:ligand-binding sensor domain-containing protein
MKAYASLLVGLALLLCATDLFAQTSARPINQFSHEIWQTDRGLPQNSIQAIVQTRDGYLWVGTQGGFARFDGVRFTVYDRVNTAQILVNDIRALLEAKDGTLWVGTFGGGLVSLKAGQFRAYATADGLLNDSVMALAEDRDGAIWIATQGGGLNRLTAQGFTAYSTAHGLGSPTTTSVIVDARGAVWAGTAGGASRFEDGRFVTYTSRDGLAGDAVTALAADPAGGVWIGTSQGLTRWRDGAAVTYTVREGLPHAAVQALHVDVAGDLWVGTPRGLARLKDGAFSTLTRRDGLGADTVSAIFQDREGSYWIGTRGGGVSRWRDSSFVTYGAPQGLLDENVYSVAGSRSGGFWAGTPYGALYRFKNGRFAQVATEGSLADTAVRAIRALFEDRRGNVWISSGEWLYRYNGATFVAYDRSSGLPGLPVRVVFEDRNGRIWVGTEGGGLSYLEGDRFVTYTARDGLAEDRVRAIVQARDGALWIGTYGGVSHFKDGVFQTYTAAQGLSHSFVRTLYLDDDGTLWIGTSGGGLNHLKNGRITAYGIRDGLVSDTTYQILDDGLGYLWLSCSTGVFRVSKHQLEEFSNGRARSIVSTLYSEADGMKNRECSGGSPAGVKTDDGRLWFPTVKGIAMVEPANLSRNPQPPPVLVEEVLVDGRRVTPGERLQAGSQRVEFHYTGLSFIAPARMRFAYRLEGFDPEWVDAGMQRTTSYTNIPPGSYRFLVKAANNEGVWSTTEASFAFFQRPHFYQTTLFYGVSGLLVVAAGAGFYYLRTRQLRARQRDLEAKVNEAVAQVKTLSGLLPICASCKRIRDDGGYWSQIELYVREHSEATFSHGMCPECVRKLYPDYAYIVDRQTPSSTAPESGKGPPSSAS